MASDLQTQVTALYNRLSAVNAALSQRALISSLITIQNSLVTSLNSIASDVETAEAAIRQLQLDIADTVEELRAKS